MKKSKAMLKKEKQQKLKMERDIKKIKKSIENTKLFNLGHVTSEHIKQPSNVKYESDTTKSILSNNSINNQSIVKKELSEEMLERERLAQIELNKKSKRIAPLYNKGAYQYITEETDLTTIARKI